jgi:hypothetical protein
MFELRNRDEVIVRAQEKLRECNENERCDCGGTEAMKVNFGNRSDFSIVCLKCGEEPKFTKAIRGQAE